MDSGVTTRRYVRPRRSRPRGAIGLVLVSVLAVWMSAVSLVGAGSTGDRELGARLALARAQADCASSTTGSDTSSNWGAVDQSADSGCSSSSEDDIAGSNWGSVPPSAVIVRLPLDDRNVVQLPELVAESSGEVGMVSVDLCGTAAKPATGNLDPSWNDVNRWDPEVLTAVQQVYQETGVLIPGNVVKSIMRIESGGDPNAGPAYGLLQVTAGAIGSYDLPRARTEPGYGIYSGAKELALRYLDSGKLPWENVAVGYFSGHYMPNGAKDEFSSDYQYQDRFKQFLAQLETYAPSGRGCETTSSGGKGIESIWGNKLFDGGDAPISQGFGPTDFSKFVHPEWYSYALEYGFTEPGHTGLDVAIPAGTPLYAPLDSTVVCAGTDNGDGEDSCAAFLSAQGGPTSGRLQLKLPNGDMLILGHVNQSIVQPGQQVKAGQEVGISGGFNGDHVHVEYRIRDSSTGSGWRIVDPREPLNGIKVTITPGPSVTPMTLPTPEGSPVADASPEAGASPEIASPVSGSPEAQTETDASPESQLESVASPETASSPETELVGEASPDTATTKLLVPTPQPAEAASAETGTTQVEIPETAPEEVASPQSGTTEVEIPEGEPTSTPFPAEEVASPQSGTTEVEIPVTGESPTPTATTGVEAPNPEEGQTPTATTGPETTNTEPCPTPTPEVLDDASPTATPTPTPEPLPDKDSDCLPDQEEPKYGADPDNPDSDGDGLRDGDEVILYHSNPTNVESDGDGLSDFDEVTKYQTDPSKADTDGDGLNDPDEMREGTDPRNIDSFPPRLDPDNDGLSDFREQSIGSDPNNQDSDGDGLLDGDEVRTFKSNPTKVDSDDDGLPDYEEVMQDNTDPAKADTDADGFSDQQEISGGSDPRDPSSTPQSNVDSDGDGLADLDESQLGTDPSNPDSDGDGLPDGAEVSTYFTNPLQQDSDSDGASDQAEVNAGTDPNDSNSFP